MFQSGKKTQKSTCGRIFHLIWYEDNLLSLLVSSLVALLDFIVISMQEEISGWREDLFTARKSAINLLGVISMSKVSFPNSCFHAYFIF